MSTQADLLVADLRKSGTRIRAANEKRYLKSDAVFYGVTVPQTRALARTHSAPYRKNQDLAGALKLARGVWSDGAHESRTAAIVIVCSCDSFYDDRVWTLGQRWLRSIDNWAHCDGIGPGMLAPFVQSVTPRCKTRRREVLGWTGHRNPWLRRGALLATMRTVRYDKEWKLLFSIAAPLVEDPDYYVQKGLGWMLRECGHHNPREVISFIQEHREQMRRSTITNAISRLPKTLQKAARTG
jgi:3-methyladenine DNA glycosylase AlkD